MYHLLWTEGLEKEIGWSHQYGNYNRVYTLNGNTLSWYIKDTDAYTTEQLNRSNITYRYVAIG